MRTEEPPPLSPFAVSLIEADRRRPGPPADLRRRMIGHPGGSARARRFSLAAAAALVGRLSLGGKVAAAMAVTGAVATGVTVEWQMSADPVPAPPTRVSRAPVRPPVARLVVPEAAPLPPLVPPPEAPAAAPPRVTRGERELLDEARAALASLDGAVAERRLSAHARLFPDGDLAEERDALEVAALVVGGKPEVAVRRAARFHRRYPASVFGTEIDRAIAANR